MWATLGPNDAEETENERKNWCYLFSTVRSIVGERGRKKEGMRERED